MATEHHVYVCQMNCSYKLQNIVCYTEHVIVCATRLKTMAIFEYVHSSN